MPCAETVTATVTVSDSACHRRIRFEQEEKKKEEKKRGREEKKKKEQEILDLAD